MASLDPALVFIGFMGAGKSNAARSAAAALGVRAYDSDRELERTLGEAIETFFDREGEAEFRRREEEVVLGLLARDDARVIALGGGALGSERVREALRGHVTVHVEVDPDTAWRRATGRGRPLARDRGRFDALHAERPLELAIGVVGLASERRGGSPRGARLAGAHEADEHECAARTGRCPRGPPPAGRQRLHPIRSR